MARNLVAIALMMLLTTVGSAAAAPVQPTSKPVHAAEAAPGGRLEPRKQSTPLDTNTVRKYYLDGDFDPAIDLIETTLRYKNGFSHEDSVFMFKHLGVMYAAKYETREKGKHFMLRLLEVEPTARILDMYASDMIYMIFKNIKDEFDSARDKLNHADANLGSGNGVDKTGNSEPSNGQKRKNNSTPIWIGASAGLVVAAGVVTYIYFSDEPKVTTINHNPD